MGVRACRCVPVLVGPWRTVVVFERVGFVPLLVGYLLELFELVCPVDVVVSVTIIQQL